MIDPRVFRGIHRGKLMLVIGLCFMSIHIFFLVCFLMLGITEMFCFNIFSVTFYASLSYLACKKPKHMITYACAVMIEIIAHSIAATAFTGWSAGFAMFIFCLAPLPFFLNFKKSITPVVLEIFIIASFVMLKLYMKDRDEIAAKNISDYVRSMFFMFNSIISFMMVIIFSNIYKITRLLDRLNIEEQNEELSKLAKIDPLSQLFNRRAMSEFLKKIAERAESGKGGYVVAMCDLDDFKQINDTYGHSMGDEVITTVSRIMTEQVPAEGYVCRWGGEELLFAVPGLGSDEGADIARSILKRLADTDFMTPTGGSFRVTATFGVCECDGSFSYEKAVSYADQYLYHGKQSGKNTVIDKAAFLKGQH